MCRARWTVLWSDDSADRSVRSFDLLLLRLSALSHRTLAQASAAASVARLAPIQHDAAPNCSQSPVEEMPYTKTLTIQHALAMVCPNHSKLIATDLRVLVEPVRGLPCSFSTSNTPVRSTRGRRGTCPIRGRLPRSRRSHGQARKRWLGPPRQSAGGICR